VNATRARILRASARTYTPPPRLNVADWLDGNRVVGRDYPSPFPGPWRTGRTPYLRAPLNDFVDPEVEYLVLLFSSQIGKTEGLFGTLLYAYGVDPGPGMLVLPTLELAGAVSTDRLAGALKSCPALNVGTHKAKTTDNSVLHKRINGLPLTLAGANSTAGLSSRPVRYVWCDEVDRWPAATPEGDPLALVVQRTAAYRRRKIVLTSTPTIKGASRIEDWYARSDKRVLMAPCPRCGRAFEVGWHHVRWEAGDPSTAHLEHNEGLTPDEVAAGAAPGCGGRIEDSERAAMFAAAQWVPTAPFEGVRGYKVWAIVSPWTRLSEMVAAFLAAKKRPETLQSWVNLTRGESWEVPSERIESASLLMRRVVYPKPVPAGCKVLTCGVDTQDDRLEALVMGWGAGEESWVLERPAPFFGDPSRPDVWRELDELLLQLWEREEGGGTRVQCTLVDALGHRTASVYAAIVPRQGRRVYASIGKDGGINGQLVSASKILNTAQGNVLRYVVDASQVKGLIYSRLRLEEPAGPGVIHFPMTVGDAFFTELTAEHLLVQRNKLGVPSKRWAVRPGHDRNESLDCMGMALAAYRVICPTPAHFAALAKKIDDAAVPVAAPAVPPAPRQARTRNWNPDA